MSEEMFLLDGKPMSRGEALREISSFLEEHRVFPRGPRAIRCNSYCRRCRNLLGENDPMECPECHEKVNAGPMELTNAQVMRRWPRICAHLICESLGYATPSTAATILYDAAMGRENWCEWIAACYGCKPIPAVAKAIRCRHHHRGYMAEYLHALSLVARACADKGEPMFASWF